MKYLLILFTLIPVLLWGQSIDVGGDGGNVAQGTAVNYTYLDRTNPANINGLLDTLIVKPPDTESGGNDTLYVGIWYLVSGTTFSCRDCTIVYPETSADTWDTLVAPSDFRALQVYEGDFLSVFSPDIPNYTRVRRSTDGSGSGINYIAGNQVGGSDVNMSLSLANEQLAIYLLGNQSIYVDATDGDDAKSGLGMTKPIQTLSAVNSYPSTIIPDMNIALKTDETWRETLTVPTSGTSGNQITVSYYDSTGESGTYPIVDQIDVNDKDYITISNCITVTNEIINTGTGYILDVSVCPTGYKNRFRNFSNFNRFKRD